jgi:phosphoribosyl 1,2-cyclic phosphate phosphodiesterase
MKLLFLGTGAAEGNPALYCRCESCMNVRKTGGKDLRTRSAFRIGEHYQIDIGPDINWQVHKCGTDMYDIEHIFITHTHADHFQFEEIIEKEMSVKGKANGKVLNIYMSVPAKAWLENLMAAHYQNKAYYEKKFQRFKERYHVHALDYFGKYRIGDLDVETLKGSHTTRGSDEFALNYLFRLPDGTRLLYALDTGWYTEETWSFIEGKYVDVLILDCTFGGRTNRPEYPHGHLHVSSFLKTLERMRTIRFINEETRIFATHINPHQGLSHDAMQKAFDDAEFNVTVAYDGLTL